MSLASRFLTIQKTRQVQSPTPHSFIHSSIYLPTQNERSTRFLHSPVRKLFLFFTLTCLQSAHQNLKKIEDNKPHSPNTKCPPASSLFGTPSRKESPPNRKPSQTKPPADQMQQQLQRYDTVPTSLHSFAAQRSASHRTIRMHMQVSHSISSAGSPAQPTASQTQGLIVSGAPRSLCGNPSEVLDTESISMSVPSIER